MKQAIDYATSVRLGLEHVSKHQQALADKLPFFLDTIDTGRGDPEFCLQRLSSHATAAALVSWFEHRDLNAFKQWCYVGGRLEYVLFRRQPKRWFPTYLLLAPLLSDHEGLISWFSRNDQPFDMERANDIRTAEFHGYQALLALRGEWETLEERCLRIIGHSPTKMKKYEVDHNFYLALARQDIARMEGSLSELTSPNVAKVRNAEQALGFTEKLIGAHAVIYAKIAWRHGFQIRIDTPWIPEEWPPVNPLASYVDPYDFLGEYQVG
jgi:hypothetical protein